MRAHFDEGELIVSLTKMKASISHLLLQPGSIGAQARLLNAAAEPFHLAVLREINNGTEDEDLAIAVANLCSNFIQSVAATIDEPNSGALVRYIMVRIHESLTGNAEHVGGGEFEVAPMPSGNA